MSNVHESIAHYRKEFRTWNRARLIAQWISIPLFVLYYDPRLSGAPQWTVGALLTVSGLFWVASASYASAALDRVWGMLDEMAGNQ